MTRTFAGHTGEVCYYHSSLEVFCPAHPWNSLQIKPKEIFGGCSECPTEETEWFY